MPDPQLDAIGSLGVLDESGAYHAFCSGTLIAKDLVVTAKHCLVDAEDSASRAHYSLSFAIGGDAERPTALIRVRSFTYAPVTDGGVAQQGSDVAAVRLERSVLEVKPWTLEERPARDLLGAELTTYGYGTDAEGCGQAQPFRPLRRSGLQTLRAVEGNVFDYIYGTYEAYWRDVLRFRAPENASERYRRGALKDDYEAWAESADESQVCFGDSGGPVTVERDGVRTILGVTSWTWPSRVRLCDRGAVIALFGPETMLFLRTAMLEVPGP